MSEKEGKTEEYGYRDVVVPGEFVEDKKGRKLGEGVYAEDDKIFAMVLGIPYISRNQIKVIPLSGIYIPQVNDRIIGIISKVEISGWLIDMNSPYLGFLPISEGVDEFVDKTRTDISKFFGVGDVIFCKVSKVTEGKKCRISMRDIGAKKLYGGSILEVKPTKVPRIIGKGGSMIKMIKEKTECLIYVGKNGVIWIKGEKKRKAIEAILKIERQSHTVGLTERIEKMLDEE